MQSLQPEESPPPQEIQEYLQTFSNFDDTFNWKKKKKQILEVFMKIQIQSHSGRMKITVSVSMN